MYDLPLYVLFLKAINFKGSIGVGGGYLYMASRTGQTCTVKTLKVYSICSINMSNQTYVSKSASICDKKDKILRF